MKHIIYWFALVALSFGSNHLDAAEPYIAVDGGLALHQNATWLGSYQLPLGGIAAASVGIKFDPGYRTDLKFGIHFTSHIDLELESGLIHNAVADASHIFVGGPAQLELYQVPLMLNAIYNIPLKGSFKPFVGVGAGGILGIVEASIPGLPSVPTQRKLDSSIGIQATAGIKYRLSSNMDIGLTYKLLHANHYNWTFSGNAPQGLSDSLNHSFLLSFCVKF